MKQRSSTHAGVAAACVAGMAVAEPQGAPAEPRYFFSAVYTGEVWRNTRGGLATGTSYLDNVDLQLEIDGERALGARAPRIFAYLLYNNGGTVSADLVGDAQSVSNIEALEQVRLYELWGEWAFGARESGSLRTGLYDLNSEFDVSEVGQLFIGSAHGIGTHFGQTGRNGPSIFPVTSLGARLAWSPSDRVDVKIAALDAVPGDPESPGSNRVRLDADDGLLLVAELGWHGERIRKLALGTWSYTAEFEDLAERDLEGRPLKRESDPGVYVLADVRLWSSRKGPAFVDGYARCGRADERVNVFDWFCGLGVVVGVLANRPEDRLGMGVAVPRTGSAFRDAVAGEGGDAASYEYAWELTYRAQVSSWLAVQPGLHYVVNPGADGSLEDALAVVLRWELSADRSW